MNTYFSEVHYEHKTHDQRRADIVIHSIDDEGTMYPIAIVECKAPGVGLGESVGDQLCDYCNSLGADYAMMINDIESFCFHYEAEKEQYIQIDSLPSYSDMVDGKYALADLGTMPDRVPYGKIPQFIEENIEELSADISPKTPRNLAYAAFNLWEGLLNPRHKMKVKSYKIFTLIEDYGVRQLSYGNAGGGVFYGLYRSFIIDYKGSTEIVSIGFTPYGSFANAEIEKTAMVVAIDNEDDSHHALQYSIDDNLKQTGNTYTFYHHGKIAIGNKGSGKVSELMQFVKPKYAEIIDGTIFNLGSLTYDKDWELDSPDVEKLIENVISYALLRDEYRAYVKSKN